MTAATLTYPLDLIRTKLSVVVDNPKDGGSKPSIIGTGRQIFRADGFFGLYRGLFATFCVSAPLFSLQPIEYHPLRRLQDGIL